jgi:hypothetical protein
VNLNDFSLIFGIIQIFQLRKDPITGILFLVIIVFLVRILFSCIIAQNIPLESDLNHIIMIHGHQLSRLNSEKFKLGIISIKAFTLKVKYPKSQYQWDFALCLFHIDSANQHHVADSPNPSHSPYSVEGPQ